MVDFKNNIHAFEDKSNTDLFRAWILFKTISNPLIIQSRIEAHYEKPFGADEA